MIGPHPRLVTDLIVCSPYLVESEISAYIQDKCAINSSRQVVGDNARAAGQFLKFAHRPRLPDIEEAEQKKCRQQRSSSCRAVAPSSVIHCPRTSSTTTNPRIFLPIRRAVSVDAQMAGSSSKRVATSRTSRPAPPVAMQHDRDEEAGKRSERAWSPWEIAATEPGGERQREPVHRKGLRAARSSNSSVSFGRAGCRDHVFLGSPIAEIDHAAAIAAERHIRVVERDFFLADGTTHCYARHAQTIIGRATSAARC